MGKYEDSAKLEFISMVGLIITIILAIILDKC